MRRAEAERWPLPRPEPTDLADAALAKREGGGGRLLRRRLLRALVGRIFALHPSAVRFTRDARGAPGLEGLAAYISTAGCIADSEAWSAVALSPRPVGVDLEAGPPTDALTRWTLTEAYLKALGAGLAIAPERVCVERSAVEGETWCMTLDGVPDGSGEVRGAQLFTTSLAVLMRQADGSTI